MTIGPRTMRCAALVLAALLGLAHSASAQTTCGGLNVLDELAGTAPELHRRVTREAEATANASNVLWRIERAGLPPSHLLGTIHLTDARVAVLSDHVQTALAAAGTIALEVADMSEGATAAAMASAGNLVAFTDGRRLDSMLSTEELAAAEQTLVAAGVPAVAAPLFRPWVVTMMLSVSECERRKVQAGQLVLDARIAETARNAGKRVVGLETIESQLAAMASVPHEQQLAMLKASLKYANRIDDNMETLLQLYLDRRLGAVWPLQIALAERVGIGREAFDGFKRLLVTDRNRRMAEAARPLLDAGAAFIAVGALHLPGEHGLVSLLRAQGYTLTPIE